MLDMYIVCICDRHIENDCQFRTYFLKPEVISFVADLDDDFKVKWIKAIDVDGNLANYNVVYEHGRIQLKRIYTSVLKGDEFDAPTVTDFL